MTLKNCSIEDFGNVRNTYRTGMINGSFLTWIPRQRVLMLKYVIILIS